MEKLLKLIKTELKPAGRGIAVAKSFKEMSTACPDLNAAELVAACGVLGVVASDDGRKASRQNTLNEIGSIALHPSNELLTKYEQEISMRTHLNNACSQWRIFVDYLDTQHSEASEATKPRYKAMYDTAVRELRLLDSYFKYIK